MHRTQWAVRYADIPPEEWVRYTATFYRTLLAAERYCAEENLTGIWIAGRLLYLLHNVPDMLRHYSEDYWATPSYHREWMLQWSERGIVSGWSEWMVRDCREIFSFDYAGNLRTLGLRAESQIVRPTKAVTDILLDRLYWWCISFRMLTPYDRFLSEDPLNDYERNRRIHLGKFATGLLPAPLLLVRWSEKGWEEYRQIVRTPPTGMSPDYETYWHNFFTGIREPIPPVTSSTTVPDVAGK